MMADPIPPGWVSSKIVPPTPSSYPPLTSVPCTLFLCYSPTISLAPNTLHHTVTLLASPNYIHHPALTTLRITIYTTQYIITIYLTLPCCTPLTISVPSNLTHLHLYSIALLVSIYYASALFVITCSISHYLINYFIFI